MIYYNSERGARHNFRSVSRRRNRPQRFSLQSSRLLAQFGICYSVNTFPSNCLLYIYEDYISQIITLPSWTNIFQMNPFHPQASTLSIAIMQQMLQKEGRGAGEIFNTRSLPEYLPQIKFYQDSISRFGTTILSSRVGGIWNPFFGYVHRVPWLHDLQRNQKKWVCIKSSNVLPTHVLRLPRAG